MSAAPSLRLSGCFELENLLTFCRIPNGKIILKETDTLNSSEGPALTLTSGQTVYGVRTVAIYLSKLSRRNLLGNSALERALVDQWLECWQTNLLSFSRDGPHVKETLKNLNTVLSKTVYLVSHQLTLADIMLYYAVHSAMMELTCQEKEHLVNLSRWFNQVQSNCDVRQYLPEVSFLRIALYS